MIYEDKSQETQTANGITKPFLSPEEQVKHLLSKGVKFEKSSMAEAEKYLEENNNYFKLRAYRKNFEKHEQGQNAGKYIDLDFEMLKDLSIIDMRLRYVLIHLALDVEHFAKVKLLKIVKENLPVEDGYSIVVDYLSHLQEQDAQNTGSNRYPSLMASINRNMDNPYCGGIISKYNQNFPIWAFLEVVPFGSLIDFYGFCAYRYDDRNLKDEYFLLKRISSLRNAAAHNNCILHDMGARDSRRPPSHHLQRELAGISKNIRKAKFSNERNIQIASLLYAHKRMVKSVGVRNRAKDELTELINRMFCKIEYYEKNEVISSTFNFFNRVVDILSK